MVGLRDGDSFALLYGRTVWVLSPTCRTEPGRRSGAAWPAEPRSSRVHRSTPAHPPVAALLPLGGAGWLPAVAPMVQQGQPRTVGREGDKSIEAVPRPWLTFNLVQMHRGEDKIGPRSAGYPLPGSVIFAAQKTLSNSTYWGFRFVGQQIQFRDYLAIFSIAIICICKLEKAP